MTQSYSHQPEREKASTPVEPQPKAHPLIEMYHQDLAAFADSLHSVESSRMPAVWLNVFELLIIQQMEEIFLNIQENKAEENWSKIEQLNAISAQLKDSAYVEQGINLDRLVQQIIHIANTYRDQQHRATQPESSSKPALLFPESAPELLDTLDTAA